MRSSVPASCSRAFSRFDTAGWLTRGRTAARPTPPSSTAAQNARRSSAVAARVGGEELTPIVGRCRGPYPQVMPWLLRAHGLYARGASVPPPRCNRW